MIPIIDTGHGYNTPGKRSDGFYDSKNRVLLKENCVNEAVGNKLSMIYYLNNKPCYFISNEWYDISLQERVDRESKLATNKTFFISIHADAFHIKDKAKGGRFFYHSEEGRKIALHLTSYLEGNGYGFKFKRTNES